LRGGTPSWEAWLKGQSSALAGALHKAGFASSVFEWTCSIGNLTAWQPTEFLAQGRFETDTPVNMSMAGKVSKSLY